MNRWLTVPNLLTLTRIAMTPLIAWTILLPAPRQALALLFAAGLTDGVDGYLARRFGWSSSAGAVLDPIADKFLMAATYIALWRAGLLPGWLIALVFGRDVLILAGAGFLLARRVRRELRPSRWGKLSTFVQLLTATAALAAAAFPAAPLEVLAGALIPLAAAATVWSGVHYFYLGLIRPAPGTPAAANGAGRKQPG